MKSMNLHNPIDNVLAFLTGLGTYGYVTGQITWHQELLKFLVAGGTAFLAGAMGIAGKYSFIWLWKKIKTLLNI